MLCEKPSSILSWLHLALDLKGLYMFENQMNTSLNKKVYQHEPKMLEKVLMGIKYINTKYNRNTKEDLSWGWTV